MSPRQPRWTAKQLIKYLKQNGFEEFAQKGSHLHLINPVTQKKVTIPIHAGKIIGPGLFKSIVIQAGLNPEELVN